MGTDLSIQFGEEGRDPFHPDPVLEVPDGRAVGNVYRIPQATETLGAPSIQELKFGLFVGQSMQPLDHQDSHHDLGGIRRPATLFLQGTGRHLIGHIRQPLEIHDLRDLLQRTPELINVSSRSSPAKNRS